MRCRDIRSSMLTRTEVCSRELQRSTKIFCISSMTPRATRQVTPYFHEIGWRHFQMLSNELLSHEPGVANSEEYGIPGQRQRGIDLLAVVRPAGVEVAQCKCEGSFSAGKIQKAHYESAKRFFNCRFCADSAIRAPECGGQ